MHHIRFFLIGDEVSLCVFGQASLDLGEDLSVLASGVELLAGLGRARSGAGVEKEMRQKQAIFAPRNSLYLMSSLAKYSSKEMY